MRENLIIITIIFVTGLLVEIMFINIKDKDYFMMSPMIFAIIINIFYIIYNLIKWFGDK